MWEIKQYKPLALVFYIDGNGNRNALPLDDSKREQFKQIIENQKMVELEWIIINTFDIKEIRPACSTSELEKYYYSRTYQERALISEKVRHRVNNPKANVLEQLSELWNEKAIRMMESWLRPKEEPIAEEPKDKWNPISEEQKAELRKRFEQLLSSYKK